MSKIPPPLPGGSAPKPSGSSVPPPISAKPNPVPAKKSPTSREAGDLSETKYNSFLPPEDEDELENASNVGDQVRTQAPPPPPLPGGTMRAPSPTQTGVFVPPPVQGESIPFDDKTVAKPKKDDKNSSKLLVLGLALGASLLVGGLLVALFAFWR